MKVLTLALNNPLFIEIQNYTLKKYFMGEYEFIVFNDAKKFPDYTNGGDVTLRKQIDETCKRLNIRCISIQNDNHQHINFMQRYSGSLDQLFSFQKENPDIYLFLDHNMFLINYFSGYLENSYVISSPWPGLIYMDFTKNEVQNIVWKVIPTIDNLGFFLELNLNVSKKEITSFWNDCHINFVKDETVLCEMYDSFLRYEVGMDKEKTMKLKKQLEKVNFNQNEKISILMPIYNGIEFIEESVGSIVEQTYTNWELIIGINGHPPNSEVYKKAKKFESPKIRVIEYNTKGKAATVNKMIADCSSNWIALLDVDDIWMKEKLENQSFYMNYDVIGTNCVYFGDIVGTVPSIPGGDFSDFDFFSNPIINSSSLVRKEIYMNYKIDETREKSGIEDYDFWLRIRHDKNRKSRFYNLPNILVKHRIHKTSAFNNTNHEKVDDLLKSYLPMIYYINLDHRTDRKEHLINELRQIDYPTQNICRIEASPGGNIGCTLSHIKTIEKFLESNQEKCIILEDDFTFYPNTRELFYKTINSDVDWNVIMLGSNTIQSDPFSENLLKCVKAQTSSGYMLHRKFATTLLENFKESSTHLRNGGSWMYTLDEYWKRLQHLNWYICNPKIGYQMESFSDIEKANVNYGV